MRQTREQRGYADMLRGQVTAAGLRVRIVLDRERFPIIPGRYGQVEYFGPEPDDARWLRVFTGRRQIRGRLRALPALCPQQSGDDEAR